MTSDALPAALAGLALDHVAVAVHDLDGAARAWLLLGAHRDGDDERVDAYGVVVRTLRLGDTRLELVAPLEVESGVGRFLQRRGPGLHHLALRVDDLVETLARLGEAGLEAIDEAPRAGRAGTHVAFLHPRSCGGVLVELVEHPSAAATDAPARGW